MPLAVGLIADSKAAVSGWTPASLTGLQVWFDASDTATITSSSGAVSQWNDKSGNARHAVQATGTNQPLTGTRTIGGRNAIDFDGLSPGDHLAVGTGYSLSQPFTIAVVVVPDLTDSGGRIVSFSSSRLAGQATTGSGVWSMNGGSILSSVVTPTLVSHTLVYIFNSGGSELRLDATVAASGTAGSQAILVDTLAIGAVVGGGTSPWDGALGELVITNTVVAGTDLTNLETYLRTKWGTP